MKIKLTVQSLEVSTDVNGMEIKLPPMSLSFEADDTCPLCEELLDDNGECVNADCPQSRLFSESN